METIGLIAAMTQESGALLRCIKRWERIAMGSYDCKSFELYERHYVLVTSGMGVRRASEAARELIKTYAPCLLISFGIAGAVEADLAIGDVVVAGSVCTLDHGLPTPTQPLEQWSAASLDAARRVLAGRGANLYEGTAITTNGSQVTGEQLRGLLHPILEMETTGIARSAAESGVKLYSVRAISDGPQSPIPIDLGAVMDEDANLRVGKMMKAVLRNPGVLLRARGMMRNSELAANHAALALIEMLNSLAQIE